jgi:hypothetical protein
MSSRRPTQLFLLSLFSLLAFSSLVLAQTPPSISGSMTASDVSSRPDLGSWEYTLNVSWDTGSGRRLAYFDIFLDDIARGCSNEALQSGVVPGDTVGLATYKDINTIYFHSEFMFQGDPVIPSSGQVLKIAPFLNQIALPGQTGSGEFKIFSNFGPTGFEYPGLFLVDETGACVSVGNIMGFFPGLTCDPVANEKRSWSDIKSLYQSQ